MIHGVEQVQVPIPRHKEDQARSFYGGILGLRELNRGTNLLRGGGLWFALPDGRELVLGASDEFRPQRKPKLSLSVNDLDALADTLGRAGHRTEWDFATEHPQFFCQDPFGNRLHFLNGAT